MPTSALKRLAPTVLCAIGACGPDRGLREIAASSDAQPMDASEPVDVQVRSPMSLIRVTRQDATPSFPGSTNVSVRLFPPAEEGSVVEHREIGECFYRRTPAQRLYLDGVATWRTPNAQGELRPFGDGGPFFAVIAPTPIPSTVIEVALAGSTFPSFAVRAPLALPLIVTLPAAENTHVPMPPAGEALVVRWRVPTFPASVVVRASWEEGVKNVYCIVPATRGEYAFPMQVMEMFRSSRDASLVVSHANAVDAVAGDRPLRYIVEYLSAVVTITP